MVQKSFILQMCVMILLIALSSHSMVYGQGSPNVTLIANVNDYPAVGYSSCWGYTAPNGREYALLGVRSGTSIIDITNNSNVVEVAFIPGPTSTWRELKTCQQFAYVVNETGGGMHIIDLSDLPNSATLAATYTGFTTAHTLYIDEPNSMLYAEGTSSAPVRAISLADPLNPVQVSTFGLECHDMYARDNMVYVAEGNSRSIGIFDLNIPSSPVFVARFQIPSAGYVHNVWLSDDGNYVMTTEETTGKTVKIWDIQNLSNVTMVDQYLGPSNLAHNVLIKGNFAYIAHYADGLRIVDISDPTNIFEAGFYDTHPGTGGFNGAWGAFPFFPSGKILISDIQSGLWVFSFQAGAPSIVSLDLTPTNPPIVIPPQGGQFGFTRKLTNNTNASQSVQVWNAIRLPNGESIGPTIGPISLTLGPGETFTRALTQNVPSQAPAGQFTYFFNVGNFPNRVISTDSFTFIKSSSASAAKSSVSNWAVLDIETNQLADELMSEVEVESQPEVFVLEQNYPNPFNPSTIIAYQLPRAERVKITIYDLSGRQVRELVNEFQHAGSHTAQWDGRSHAGQVVSSGLYIYQIQAGEFVQSRKMLFEK